MTGHSYIAIWPIEDRDRPVSALIAEACRDLDRMAALVGARIVGQPEWSVNEDRLACRALARPWNRDSEPEPRHRSTGLPAETIATIQRLASAGWTVRAIAEFVGVSKSACAKYARKAA